MPVGPIKMFPTDRLFIDVESVEMKPGESTEVMVRLGEEPSDKPQQLHGFLSLLAKFGTSSPQIRITNVRLADEINPGDVNFKPLWTANTANGLGVLVNLLQPSGMPSPGSGALPLLVLTIEASKSIAAGSQAILTPTKVGGPWAVNGENLTEDQLTGGGISVVSDSPPEALIMRFSGGNEEIMVPPTELEQIESTNLGVIVDRTADASLDCTIMAPTVGTELGGKVLVPIAVTSRGLHKFKNAGLRFMYSTTMMHTSKDAIYPGRAAFKAGAAMTVEHIIDTIDTETPTGFAIAKISLNSKTPITVGHGPVELLIVEMTIKPNFPYENQGHGAYPIWLEEDHWQSAIGSALCTGQHGSVAIWGPDGPESARKSIMNSVSLDNVDDRYRTEDADEYHTAWGIYPRWWGMRI